MRRVRPPVKSLRVVPHHRPGSHSRKPEYQNCQIETPDEVVKKVWALIQERRQSVGTVIDLGAGDGRFSNYGNFSKYVGIEIDPDRITVPPHGRDATIQNKCILDSSGTFDAAVGNPPYIRHQDLSPTWVAKAKLLIQSEIGVSPNGLSNLYAYFMWLSLLRTKSDGIIAMVVPFGWTYRPAFRELRSYIWSQGWSASVYRLPSKLKFAKDVDPSPAITLIDKRENGRNLNIYQLCDDLTVDRGDNSCPGKVSVFPYDRHRGRVYAQRGLSTGSQRVFLLTEEERRKAGISRSSVVPCIATLRPIPYQQRLFLWTSFKKFYVGGGERCWLLRTDLPRLHFSVKSHLDAAPRSVRQNSTCGNRNPWFAYALPPVPSILYASAFSGTERPKIVINEAGVVNVGSVHAIYVPGDKPSPAGILRNLRKIDFREGTVPWDNGMRKIEVAQMNGLLKRLM